MIIARLKEIPFSYFSETGSDKIIEYPGKINLSQLSNLRVVKIKHSTQYYDGQGGFPPLAPLFAFFDLQTNSPLALELFEIDFEIDVIAAAYTEGMEHAVTDLVRPWDKLDQDLASNRFPHLREVSVSVRVLLLHINEKQRVQVEQKIMEGFQYQLPRLRSSPLVAVRIKVVVENDW